VGGGRRPRLIHWFVGKYGVDMSEAENPDIASYASFNDFFGRPLKPGARPLADADFISPVDGCHQPVRRDRRSPYPAGQGGIASPRPNWSAGTPRWRAGSATAVLRTLYLSPRDYHRLHMPCAGRLQRMIYVPGALFSVNPVTARGVPGLFAPQRTRGLRVRFRNAWALRDGAGRRDDCRQHGHHMARGGQSAAHRSDCRVGIIRTSRSCSNRARKWAASFSDRR
jgi:hypothetical protein